MNRLGLMDRLFRLAVVLLAGVAFHVPDVFAQNDSFTEPVVVAIHVSVDDTLASDSNAGTDLSPLKTLRSAVARAVALKKSNQPSLILVHNGVYREGPISFGYTNWSTNDPDNSTPIEIRAVAPGNAIISGSDVLADWRPTNDEGVFVHSWTEDWGAAPNPWADDRSVAEIVLRREMVFVDGQRFEQVIDKRKLDVGQFYVDEPGDQILLHLGPERDPDKSLIEAAMRSRLWDQNYENNVTISGLVFEHVATPWGPADAAVWISGSKNVVVDNCDVRETNWQGLYIGESSDIRIQSTRMNGNGGQGWGMFRGKNLEAFDNETSYNNWRGELGDFTGWSVGNKILSVHGGLIRNHKAVGNYSRGIWLDYDISEVVLDGVELRENTRDGLWIEASQGPITVKNSQIRDNLEGGIRSTYSRWVVVDSNVIAGNKQGQIQLDGTGKRSIRDFETREAIDLTLRDWVITRNTISGKAAYDTGQVFKRSDWRLFVNHLVSDENRYVSPDGTISFSIVNGRWSLSEWQTKTGQDTRSTEGS